MRFNGTEEEKMKKTIGYVFGGTISERMQIVLDLKKECYMVISSPTKRVSIIHYMERETSHGGIVNCLYQNGYTRYIR